MNKLAITHFLVKIWLYMGKRQSVIASFSAIVELKVMAQVIYELIRLRTLLKELRVVQAIVIKLNSIVNPDKSLNYWVNG